MKAFKRIKDPQTRKIVFGGSILVLVVASLVVAYLAFQSSQAEEDPFVPQTTETDVIEETETTPELTPTTNQSDAPVSELDPATVATVDVEPLNLTVSYVRGVPGFSFVVLRTQSGTQYVEFRSEDVAGTRCTNDEGAFASIIQSPSQQDIPTLAQTVTLGETVYGLSLPDDTCTNNESLFSQYQDSFADAFSLLRTIED